MYFSRQNPSVCPKCCALSYWRWGLVLPIYYSRCIIHSVIIGCTARIWKSIHSRMRFWSVLNLSICYSLGLLVLWRVRVAPPINVGSGSDDPLYWILTGRNYNTVTDLPNRNYSRPNLHSLLPIVYNIRWLLCVWVSQYDSRFNLFLFFLRGFGS
jgi:hypothetical protein